MSDDLLRDLFDIGTEDITHTERTKVLKAPFGWPGGKSQSIHYLLEEIKPRLNGKWVEVFGGSGILSWNVPQQEIMVFNDAYSGVVDFYRCLQDPITMRKCQAHINGLMPPLSREQWMIARAQWCTSSVDYVRAALWYYMVKNSVIQKGKSFARGTNSFMPINIPAGLDTFAAIHNRLQRFQLENLDFRTCIQDYDSANAVFYCDPPYINTDGGLYPGKWGRENLRDLLRLIDQGKGTFLLSGYYDEEIVNSVDWTSSFQWTVGMTAEAQAWTVENKKAGCDNPGKDRTATEYLWIKENELAY